MDKPSLMLEINIPAPGTRPGAGFLHAYVEALCREIEAGSEELSEYDIRTLCIHGAGGPNDLDLRVLTRTLHQRLDLSHTEKVVEIAPERISTANMSTWKNFHTDLFRIHLGSLNYADFLTLELPYEYHHHVMIRKLLSYSDMTNVCLGLYTGIPKQSVPSLRDSLNRVMEFAPDQVCLVPYSGSEKSSSAKRGPSDAGIPSGTGTQPDGAALYEEADRFLSEHGYGKTSVYEYALPGKDSLRTRGMNTDGEYWGIGVGAVSFLDGCILRSTTDPDAYIRAQGNAQEILVNAVRLDEKSLALNYAFRSLNGAEGLDPEEFVQRFADEAPFLQKAAASLTTQDLARTEEGCLVLTARGVANMPRVREILAGA